MAFWTRAFATSIHSDGAVRSGARVLVAGEPRPCGAGRRIVAMLARARGLCLVACAGLSAFWPVRTGFRASRRDAAAHGKCT